MCFHSKLSKSAQELKNRFKASFENEEAYQAAIYNGFQHPKTPVITNKQPSTIQLFDWGLIPPWAKDTSIQKSTLNAKIETLHEKPSFKNVMHNHCLVLADAFYEWQWLDDKGKNKQKYELTLPNNEAFAFAGIWSQWHNPATNEWMNSYSILTTEANELMGRIHNTKKRMPVIIAPENEQDWLQGMPLALQNSRIIATAI